ncbi:ATP-dependent zinc metalloprotease FtsH [Rosistilla carotiformis]|uniref:ATP-dependent zinc metalloprotease FtsH n=1 Tax=Rosistilla carotiformis TaxID=2528017 RepID=A0A518JYP1_9BACT|nr:cell division protein FtsH [Rosistilla carotiformis]QDV70662.1 ATP-dependent zinc metalloprotease FtsH [Rosistilla carotiformis]
MNEPAADPAARQAAIELTATAYHEAGHAVMAISLGRPIQKVTIAPGPLQTGGYRLGVCELRKGRGRASQDVIEDEALILLAGMVAEARFTGRYCPRGAAADLRTVERVLEGRAKTQRQLERLQRRLLDKTEHLLSDEAHAVAIERIAKELIEKTTISGRAVRHLFEQAQQQFG